MNFREVLRLGRGCLRSRDCALKTREVYSNLDSARIRGTSEYLTWLQLNCQPAGCNTILTHGFLYFFPHMTCTYYVREQKLGSKQKLWGEGERGAGREVTKPGEKPSRPVTSHEEIWECLLIRIETPRNSIPLTISGFLHSNPKFWKQIWASLWPRGSKRLNHTLPPKRS